MFNRRTVLRAAAGSVAGLSAGISAFRIRTAFAQEGGDAPVGAVGTRQLADHLHVLTVDGTNVVALTGVDGALLVDGGSTRSSAALLSAVARLPTSGPVHTLFNTHWHPEQVGSNETLGAAGATIIAQENTKLWLSTDVTWPWNGQTFEPLPAKARPNKTFYDEGEVTVGSQTVQYGYLRHAMHTDGDLYVYFPDDNVMAVGGAVTGKGWHEIDWWTGGWIGGVVGGLELLLSLTNPQTRIVPAAGPVLTRADLESQFQMYSTVYERLSRLLNSGRSPQEATESAVTVEFDEKMGNSDAFVVRAFESMWGYLSPDA